MELSLQIFLLLVTTGAAVFGVFAKAYDKEGNTKVTIWGKVAIAGAIIGLAISVAIQVSHTRESERVRRETDAAIQQQLNEIRRAVYTTTGMQASFAIAYPLPTDGSSPYRERLAPIVRALLADKPVRVSENGFKYRAVMLDPPGVVFDGQSTWAPKPSAELDEATTVDLSEVTVDFSVKGAPETASPHNSADAAKPSSDLRLNFSADARRDLLGEFYIANSDEIMMWTPLQEAHEYRNAAVRSIQDLLGATLHVSLTNTTLTLSQRGRERYEGKPNWKSVEKMRRQARLVWLHLHFTDWGDICISEKQMKHAGGITVELPATMEALRSQYGDTSRRCEIRF